jgi:hypothetical protein
LAVLTIGKNHFKATKELKEELSNGGLGRGQEFF